MNVNRQVEECLWNCFEKNHLGPFMCTRRELSGRGPMRLNNNSSKSHHNSVSCFSFFDVHELYFTVLRSTVDSIL